MMCQLSEASSSQVSNQMKPNKVFLQLRFSVLNKEDPDWYWIVRTDGGEGFVPCAFVYPAENILQNQDPLSPVNTIALSNATAVNNMNNTGATGGNLLSLSNNSTQQLSLPNINSNVNFIAASNIPATQCQLQQQILQEPAQHSNVQTELVMLYDYKAQAPDDLSVRRGK